MCSDVVMATLNIICIRNMIRTFNNTNNITKLIRNYSNDIANNYKINKINIVKKSWSNFIDDVFYKNSTIYITGTYNITKNNS